jgi:hypothetical protein
MADTSIRQAPRGYAWFSIDTPTFFTETLLPLDWAGPLTDEERKAIARLEEAAERHGARIDHFENRRG